MRGGDGGRSGLSALGLREDGVEHFDHEPLLGTRQKPDLLELTLELGGWSSFLRLTALLRIDQLLEAGDPLADLESIRAATLALPADERERPAHALLASLDDDVAEDPKDVETAWDEEIKHRVQDYEAGKVETVPWSEVRAGLRAIVNKRRAR